MSGQGQQPSAVGVKRRACVNCTSGKSKCTPFSASECERCHRLGKDCVYLNLISKRKRPEVNSRMKLLEKKVDGLVSLLANHPTDSSAVEAVASLQQPIGVLEQPNTPREDTPSTVSTSLSSGTSLTGGEVNNKDIIDRGLLSREKAHELLQDFRSEAVKHFPFVVVAPHVEVQQLRSETPFLFLSIMTSMLVKDCHLQRRLGEEVRLQIFRRVMLDNEKSLELLQGVLVYLAWYQYHYHPQRQQMLLLSQICVNLVYEMGLDGEVQRRRQNNEDPSHQAVELRALLGTYYMASSFATKVQKRCTMPHTKFMRDASHWLAGLHEYSTDEAIPYLVATHEIAGRVHDVLSIDSLDSLETGCGIVTDTVANGFLQELNNLHAVIPAHLHRNVTLSLEFPMIRAMIQQVALHNELWLLPQPLSASAQDGQRSAMSRVQMLVSSVADYKDFLSRFKTYPAEDSYYLTFPTFSKLCQVLGYLAKLVNLALSCTGERERQVGDSSPETEECPLRSALVEGDTELPSLMGGLQQKLRGMASDIFMGAAEMNVMTVFSLLVGGVLSGYDKRLRAARDLTYSGPRIEVRDPVF